jgi:hypothetical protein
MEEIVETMRKAVEVKVLSISVRTRPDFLLSLLEGKEPRTVMMDGLNKLCLLFIEET